MANSRLKSQTPNSPDRPVYQPHQSGIFPYLPRSLIPYAELMRLDRPSGFYAFYWHYTIGLAFAANLSSSSPPLSPTSLSSLFALAILTAAWVVVYRGAVCAWNDALDAEYDRRVARCMFRPVARGAVGVGAACAFAFALLGVAGLPVWRLLPREANLGFGAMTLVLGVYPLGKRWTDFPQLMLGVGLAMPVGICAVAFGGEGATGLIPGVIGKEGWGGEGWALGSLYAADLLWTVIFDTVYAHQDIRDDVKAGVKSLAVRLGERTKPVLGALGFVQVVFLVVTGVCARLGPGYFIITCGGSGSALLAMLVCVDLETPASCAWWFGPGSRLVGFSIVLGFMASYIPKYY